MKSYADRKEYYKAHRDEILAKRKAHYQAHKEELKAYREAHKNEKKAYDKAYVEANREKIREKQKAYYASHRNEKYAYIKADTNSNGITKNSIRSRSHKYLFNVLKHTKIKGYEIHHCFGYDDYRHFIYIPKELHLEIHQFLRNNGIDADSNHYAQIEHIIINYYKHNDKHFLVL